MQHGSRQSTIAETPTNSTRVRVLTNSSGDLTSFQLPPDSSRVEYSDERFDAIHFRNCVVNSELVFENCTFTGIVDFDGSKFQFPLRFTNCTFQQYVLFRGASLADRTRFESCRFRTGASFAAGYSTAGAGDEHEVNELRHVRFRSCEFNGYVTFNNRTFVRSPDFSHSTFGAPPHFQNATVHRGAMFDGAEFLVPSSFEEEELARAAMGFRCLQRVADEMGDRARHHEFVAKELQVRRRLDTTQDFEKAIITIYQIVSDFGRSILRPIVFLVIIGGIMCVLTGIATYVADSTASTGDIVLFVVQQSLRPFSILESDYQAPSSLSATYAELRGLMVLISTLQGLAQLTAAALFLFAIKRRFS
jgi:hypothetical protein